MSLRVGPRGTAVSPSEALGMAAVDCRRAQWNGGGGEWAAAPAATGDLSPPVATVMEVVEEDAPQRWSSGGSSTDAGRHAGVRRPVAASPPPTMPDSKEVYCSVALQQPGREKEAAGKVRHDEGLQEPVFHRLAAHEIANSMKRGLHKSLEELSRREDRVLDPGKDFTIKSKYFFNSQGDSPATAGGGCCSRQDAGTEFVFTDFSPMCYRHIRKGLRVDTHGPGGLMEGLCATSWKVTPAGKSSALLYFAGSRFVVKTMTREESKFLRRILHLYYHHVRNNPYTLLPHFLGHYSIRYVAGPWRGKITFVVMNNVFNSQGLKVHSKFDLKGSTVGRRAEKDETILKDLDLREMFHVGSARKQVLEDQINRDSMFLEECDIMDYSFLVGVHRPETPRGRRRRPRPMSGGYTEACLVADEGGMVAAGGGLSHAGEVYYFGIIDILQRYTGRKMAEYLCKGIVLKKSMISVQPPRQYARRFRNFIYNIFV